MCTLQRERVYVVFPLTMDCPTCAGTRVSVPDCYSPESKLRGMDIIYEFSRYPNTLGFSAGNEVNHFTPSR
jgi:hypothetical protein